MKYVKYFVMFVIALITFFFLSAMAAQDYVGALIQLVCLLMNVNAYKTILAREREQRDNK